ncbi:MAG TPA: Asp-tRNA(Asn)/Glu-tRNA(Gln) amidotransferase subunit GatA [Candidatus Dormibacteraeota bacterium]|nr:Asp-tRNA(Asn)/Glu-tRNA(Gln) amidotransferase subunit GatA [Candidatus Dormibacteraeota bacterium]
MTAASQYTVAGVRAGLAAKEFSARELIDEYYARIERENPRLNAYLALCPERAYAQADRVDRMVSRGGELPPLAGLPLAVKDVLATRGVATTCASRILEGYRPPYDATAVTRLEGAGAVVLGKTNCDEFAMGSSNENSAYGPVRNPVAPDHVPGGSSGGSAAAVAAGLAVAALGTDTGGSVRQPASFCGISALMPTYGRVSRYGLVAFASSLDRIGPMTASVADAAALLGVIAGHDPCDATSASLPVPDYVAEIGKPVAGLRVGVPREYFAEGIHPEVRARVEAGIQAIEHLGCRLVELSMPATEYAVATYYLIATAEASSNLARYDGVRYGLRVPADSLADMYRKTRGGGFGAEVKRRIMLGTYALSAGYYEAYYLKAQKARALIARDFQNAFETVDLLVTPTSPIPAFRLGEHTGDPLAMYLADIFTVTGSLAGVPGVSIPCGTTSEGLPVGLQIFGPHFGEARVLALAHAFERAASPQS